MELIHILKTLKIKKIIQPLSSILDSLSLSSSMSPAASIFSSSVAGDNPWQLLNMWAQCKRFSLCSLPDIISIGLMQGGTPSLRASAIILEALYSPWRLRPDLSH